MAKKTIAEIRDSLMEQLKIQGKSSAHFENLVDEYIDLLKLTKKLKQDIKKRGINYTEKMSTGFEKTVNNPSIKDLMTANKQALAILHELGVTAEGTDFMNDKM